MAVIGIDLGTTHSVMARIDQGRAVAIPNAEGALVTPSMVAFNIITEELLVGAAAQRQAVLNPRHTIFSVKRLLGRAFDDPVLKLDKQFLPYELRAIQDGHDILVQLGKSWYAPHDLAALILQKLKHDAEVYLDELVTEAVITVPAYYNHVQRHAVRKAGEKAGLEVIRVINEPTAAALAYGSRDLANRTLAVCHLGGGTFDVSIVETGEGVVTVQATSGDAHLGGDDFDWLVMAWICETFQAQTGIDLTQDRGARSRLREAVEAAKCRLSTVQETAIHLPHIARWVDPSPSLDLVLTREQLEELTRPLLARLKPPCEQVLEAGRLQPGDIDEVILIGQQSQMPAVQRTIASVLGRTPRRALDNVCGVALGAAIQAGILQGNLAWKPLVLVDVTPFPIGIAGAQAGLQTLVPSNTAIPCRKQAKFTTAEDAQTSVDVRIYLGDCPQVRDNIELGHLHLDGLIPAPKGTPKIDAVVDVDVNGVLQVTLRERHTGRARRWECGHDALFHLLDDTPAFVDMPEAASSFTPAPHPDASTPPPPAAPPSRPAARPVCPDVLAAAQSEINRADSWLANSPLEDIPHLRHLLLTYVSSTSQALAAQVKTPLEVQTRALQILLDSLEALKAGELRRATAGLSTLISIENNPQARADLGQILRQIGRGGV